MKQAVKTLQSFWHEQRGDVSVAGLILTTAIVALGGIAGLVAMRDLVIQEIGDVAVALDQVDQSFAYTIRVDGNGDGDFVDPQDSVISAAYVDPAPTLTDPNNAAPADLQFNVASAPEGTGSASPVGTLP